MSAVEQFGAQGVVIEKLALKPDGAVAPTGETERLAAEFGHSGGGRARRSLAVARRARCRDPARRHCRGRSDSDDWPVRDIRRGRLHRRGADDDGGRGPRQARRPRHAGMDGQKDLPASGSPFACDLRDAAPARLSRRPARGAAETPLTRRTGFGEIVAGLAEPQARFEAMRCLSCGNCFECDNCYAACPEQAIARLGPGRGYEVDLTLCTGCAVCFEQCPCHAIEMTPEPAPQDLAVASRTIGSLGEPIAPSRLKVRL